MKTLRGISLSGNAAAELLSDRTASGFPLVEFDGELLESAEFERAVKKVAARRSPPQFTVRNLIAEPLTLLAPGESAVVRQEFARAFRNRCRRAAELHVTEVGLSFDLERSFTDAAYREKMFLLLHGFFGILEEFALTLRCTVRLPAPFPPERYAAFRRRLQSPRTGLELELRAFDTELPEPAELAELLSPLRFHSDCWHFRRDPVTGALPGREVPERIAAAAGTLCAAPRRFYFPVATAAELADFSEQMSEKNSEENLPGLR